LPTTVKERATATLQSVADLGLTLFRPAVSSESPALLAGSLQCDDPPPATLTTRRTRTTGGRWPSHCGNVTCVVRKALKFSPPALRPTSGCPTTSDKREKTLFSFRTKPEHRLWQP
jgi:hypothetical protein